LQNPKKNHKKALDYGIWKSLPICIIWKLLRVRRRGRRKKRWWRL